MTIRLDPYALVYQHYVSPGASVAAGYVCRPFAIRECADAYAKEVAAFFAQNAVTETVYVIQGPTSTTKLPFEVVDNSCGYPVLLRLRAQRDADPAQ